MAGLATLVLGALAAIALSGPDAPPHGALGPPAPLPAAPPPVSATSDAPTASPSVSAVPSSNRPSPTGSPSPTTVHTEAAPVGYEAESPANVLDSGARVAPMDGASGGRGVYGIGGSDGGTLRFTGISVPGSGQYTLTVYYQSPDHRRGLYVGVNDGPPVRLLVKYTGSCCVDARTMTVTLTAGAHNTVEFSDPYGPGPDLDRIVISAA